jgi:hypothetical protein
MKKVLCAITALALAIPAVAMAMDNGRGRGLARGGPPAAAGVYRPGPPTFSFRGTFHPAIGGPAFRYPNGYGYVRFGIGARLPSIFLSAPYYFDNYYDAGLYPPSPGHRWVRYGPDLLLINLRTGQVDDVVYDVFY